ncbi:hypothetical protein K3495_g6161 [Podosphaera aphanis]|nr:hypothetical protein K3495_g6161 [Podosphaera aphanis]
MIALQLDGAALYAFVDGSHANNDDLSSQIRFVLAIGNEKPGNDSFIFSGNIVHYNSTKSKRVTRSVLGSEIYGMVAEREGE